jgi:hypothetical protein
MEQQLLSIHKDKSDLDNYKAIVEVVNGIDWGKVHDVMTYLSWGWFTSYGVPELTDLIGHATKEAERVVAKTIANKQDWYTSCGGISITTKYFPEGDVMLRVEFTLEECSNML